MNKVDYKNISGLKIGLLGGSFDPPHEGHLFISKDALTRFNLDYIWWIVAKQNTLKENKASDFDNRISLCKEFLKRESKILALDIEKQIKSENTIDVLNFLKQKSKNEYFWIMGSDSFFTLDQWPKWQEIINLIKVIVYDRSWFLFRDTNKKLNPELVRYEKNLVEFQSSQIPAWTLVNIVTPDISSTELRLRSSKKFL